MTLGGLLRYAGGKAIPLSSLSLSRKKRSVATFQEYLTKTAAKMLQYNPTSKSIEEVSADKVEKQICLLDSQFNLSGANNTLAAVSRLQKLKDGFKHLRGLLSDYLDVMKVSSLDFSVESSHDSKRFPVFFSKLQEFTMKVTQNLGSDKESEFSEDYFIKINELLQLISKETIKLRAGFIHFPDSTCQVGPTRLLQCLCKDSSDPYYKIDFSPSYKNGKILSFQNIVFKLSEFKKEELKTCYFQSDSDYFLLNKECCIALQHNSNDAVQVCPSIQVQNYSPVKVSNGLLTIDNAFKQINTRCDSSSFQIDKPSDVVRLTSCDTNIVGENNLNYRVDQNGNYNSDYIINNDVEKASELPIKDLVLFSVCGLLVLILIMLIVLLFCCFKRNLNSFRCCLVAQSTPNPDPILPIGDYEMAEIQNLRPIVNVHRARTVRSIK